MIQYAVFIALLATATCNESRRHRVEDPFASLDRHITHTLAYHYLWPWNQLIKVAAALDAEDHLEEPKVVSDANKFEINMSVKRFKPDELRVKVKNRYIIVEGKHKEIGDVTSFMANHFVQRFVLPPGSKQEEVAAILKENGVLSISAPKHELPPPPPEREVPIVVLLPDKVEQKPAKVPEKVAEKVPEKTPEKTVQPETSPEKVPENTSEKTVKPESSTDNKELTTETPLEQLDLTEATTHIGKIRKKELKTTTKTAKDNEVTKEDDGNGLDYALIEPEE